MRPPVAEATCAACMKRKPCGIPVEIYGKLQMPHDTFLYSEQHRGWICKRCHERIKELGTEGKGWPERDA